MTKDTLITLFKESGVKFKEIKQTDGLEEYTIIRCIRDGERVSGYLGLEVEFIFNPEGEFNSLEVWDTLR
jgi:hypothetical protein